MDDAALFEMIAKYAEGLNTTSLEVFRTFMYVGLLLGGIATLLCFIVFDRLMDRLFSGIIRLLRWFCSRWKKDR